MRAEDRAQSWQTDTPGVEASRRTRRLGYTPPQQPQRTRPGTAAKTAGNANMSVMVTAADRRAKSRAGTSGLVPVHAAAPAPGSVERETAGDVGQRRVPG
jgi:hypothetical protein